MRVATGTYFQTVMGGDHGHHDHAFRVPDWRHYTVGEHTPELLKNEKMLKSLGLKVPVPTIYLFM